MRREERGGGEGNALMDGTDVGATPCPPLRGETGCGAALTLPTAASPLLKRGVDDGDDVIAVAEP